MFFEYTVGKSSSNNSANRGRSGRFPGWWALHFMTPSRQWSASVLSHGKRRRGLILEGKEQSSCPTYNPKSKTLVDEDFLSNEILCRILHTYIYIYIYKQLGKRREMISNGEGLYSLSCSQPVTKSAVTVGLCQVARREPTSKDFTFWNNGGKTQYPWGLH